MKSLADRLRRSKQVASLSDKEHDEAWVLAHSLSDLADASASYLSDLPSLLDARLEGDDLIQELIAVVVRDLQHMLYHLKDPRFFRDLLDWRDSATP